MARFNVHEAKTHLSQLLARVEEGEEIVITRAGKPCARLVPAESESAVARQPRVAGRYAGLWTAAPDAFDSDPELIALFEGEELDEGSKGGNS